MDDGIKKALDDYIDHPLHEKYVALAEVISRSPSYQPYSDDFMTIRSLVQEEKYAEAAETLRSMGFARMTSPSFHWMYSWVSKKLGNQGSEKLEHYFAVQFGHEILRTGEGTGEAPYQVLWLEDEQEVLLSLEKKQLSQRLICVNNKHFDVITCEDQSEVWFDVTRPYSQLPKYLEHD